MRRILDRYLLLECLPTLGLSLAVFTFVLLMNRLLRLSDLVVTKGVPMGDVIRLLVLALPALLPLLVPAGLLLAILLAVGRLSADSEIVAMRACGVGLAQNLRPVLVLSAGVALVTAALSLWIQPRAAVSFKELLHDAVKNRIGATTETGVFTEIARGVTVYAEKMDRDSGVAENLFLSLDRGEHRGVWILARRGTVFEDAGALGLDLQDGEMHQYEAADRPYRRLRFQHYRLRIPLPGAVFSLGTEEQPTRALWAEARAGDREAQLELHRRLALPASCLVFGLLGASLGLHHARGGRSRGVILCVGVLLVYYTLFTAGRALGKQDAVPPAVAMWLPNVVLGVLGAYAFLRKNREAPLPLEEALGRLAAALRRRLVSRREANP